MHTYVLTHIYTYIVILEIGYMQTFTIHKTRSYLHSHMHIHAHIHAYIHACIYANIGYFTHFGVTLRARYSLNLIRTVLYRTYIIFP